MSQGGIQASVFYRNAKWEVLTLFVLNFQIHSGSTYKENFRHELQVRCQIEDWKVKGTNILYVCVANLEL